MCPDGGACPGVAGSAGVSGTRRGGVPALSPAYPATVVPAGGGVPALSPANPAFNLFPCPHPPSPLPGGKGVTIGYFMQGAAPLASPGLNPRGTGSPCRCGKLNGGLAPALPARQASAVPGGGRRGGSRPPTLPLVLLLPPSPRPALAERSSRREGGDQGYFMQGASPLASPGLNPRGTGSPCRCGKLNGGACPGVAGSAGVSGTRRGACRFWSPANPAFRFLFCPLSPRPPFPGGEGGDFLFSYARGCAPCIPGAEPGRHWSRGRTTHPAGVCLRNRQLAAKPIEQPFYWQCRQPRRGGTGGEELRRLRWSSPPGQG